MHDVAPPEPAPAAPEPDSTQVPNTPLAQIVSPEEQVTAQIPHEISSAQKPSSQGAAFDQSRQLSESRTQWRRAPSLHVNCPSAVQVAGHEAHVVVELHWFDAHDVCTHAWHPPGSAAQVDRIPLAQLVSLRVGQ